MPYNLDTEMWPVLLKPHQCSPKSHWDPMTHVSIPRLFNGVRTTMTTRCARLAARSSQSNPRGSGPEVCSWSVILWRHGMGRLSHYCSFVMGSHWPINNWSFAIVLTVMRSIEVFYISLSEQVEHESALPVIWDVMTLMWRHCNSRSLLRGA